MLYFLSMSTLANSPNLLSRFRVWRTILNTSIAERLAYRGDFVFGILMRFLPVITQVFLWTAVFAGTNKDQLFDYSKNELIAYYLLTMISRAFSSMPGLASGIARSIRDGSMKKFLTQPVDWIGFLLLSRIAHKLVYYVVATLPFALVFWLCRDYFPPLPDLEIWAAFIVSLLLSFVLGFFLEASLGMIGFWFLEVSSVLFVYMLFIFFLSGHMFPINILNNQMITETWSIGDVVRLMPFQYLAYFPAAVFLGKIPHDQLWSSIAVEALWTLFFIILCRWLCYRGLRRYSAYGG
jgi:ABC-2 type transport system permease protein